MEINEEALSIDIAHFILKNNQDKKQISFFLPDDYEGMCELINDGAKLYTMYQENILVGACIVDFVHDNHTIELNGPFGTEEARKELFNYCKNKNSDYNLGIFTTEKNNLLIKTLIKQESLSMEILSKVDYHNDHIVDGKDLLELAKLHDNIFPNSYASGNTLIKDENIRILAYKENSLVKGYVAYNFKEYYIDFIGVDSNYRKNGVGSKLLKACLSNMKHQVVRLTVDKNNVNAVKLYKANGFRIANHMIYGCVEE